MTGKRIVVLASGRGTDLQSLLDANADGRIASRIVAVGSDNADAKALDRARQQEVATFAARPDPAKTGAKAREDQEARLKAGLDEHDPDLVILAGYMRVLSPELVRAYHHRIVNIHPALLPSFPGLHGQKQAIDWGVRVAGCTTHFVDEQVDHGPIILQAAVPVRPKDDEDTLSRRILAVEHQILPRTVNLWEQGRLRIDGRHVRIDADESWTTRYDTIAGVLYGPGY